MGWEEGKQEEIILAFSRKLWVFPNIDTAKAFHRRNQFPFRNAAVILLGRLLFPTWVLCMDFIPFLSPDPKEHNNWCFLRGFDNYFFFNFPFFPFGSLLVRASNPNKQNPSCNRRIDFVDVLWYWQLMQQWAATGFPPWLWCVVAPHNSQAGPASCLGIEVGKISQLHIHHKIRFSWCFEWWEVYMSVCLDLLQ